jgi:hypothetical protein
MSTLSTVKPYKVYAAVRGLDGYLRITVNGQPLRQVVYHSPTGMEWGYAGSGPADLALSILADFFGEQPSHRDIYFGLGKCVRLHQRFKFAVIADAPKAGFEIHASADGFFLRMDDPSKGFRVPPEEPDPAPDDHLEAAYEERFEG